MPLGLVRSSDIATLWDTCVTTYLDDIGDETGPGDFPAFLWLTNRNLRDRLLEHAYARGVQGWLGPPFALWWDLPKVFDIRGKFIGLLTRRRMVSRLAFEVGKRVGLTGLHQGGNPVVRGHMLDRVFSDLLPEGVTADTLQAGLSKLDSDDFGRRRNAWVVETYRAYLAELDQRRLMDLRSVPSRIAQRIEDGGLPAAIRGAKTLHLYGFVDLRARGRLFRALAAIPDTEVRVYLLAEDEPSEWEELAESIVEIDGPTPPTPDVQPAPDGFAEARWVASQVKQSLILDDLEPHRVAIVARSGQHDTRRILHALRSAGVPATARLRAALSEIGAVKAFLGLFQGAAKGWSYRSLRSVLASGYFKIGVGLRVIDHLASGGRLSGLDEWGEQIQRVLDRANADEKTLYNTGLFLDHLQEDSAAFARFRGAVAPLSKERTERAWVELTLELVQSSPFDLRKRLSDPVGEEWEVVRFDQRGVRQLERLLAEWAGLADDTTSLDPAAWHRVLKQLLESQTLALTTPLEKGVQVLEAQDASLTPFDRVFMVHANDAVFPRTSRSPGVFSNEERAGLSDSNLPLERRIPLMHRDGVHRSERTLWRATTQQAGVTICYRTTDFRGTPRLPSLMVPAHDPAKELPRSRIPQGPETSLDEALTKGALALMRSRDDASLLPVRTPEPERLRHAILAAHAESQRTGVGAIVDNHPGLRANPWNGELRDPAVLEHLAQHFGGDRVWSATQLEQYGTLPFGFLIDRVLKLEARHEAEEETTALTFGGVAHRILERFYAQVKDRLPVALDAPTEQLLESITDEVIRGSEESSEWLGDKLLWLQTQETIRQAVRDYVAWELPYLAEKSESPLEVEWAFGYEGSPGIELVGADVGGVLRTLHLRGKIDRVDRAMVKSAEVHHVLDYKSRAIPTAGGYKDGSVLQAPLYLSALEAAGYAVGKARYRGIKRPGEPQNGAEIHATKAGFDDALSFAFSIPSRIRRGLFEPVLARVLRSWRPWDPELAIARSRAVVREGSRFDGEAGFEQETAVRDAAGFEDGHASNG